MAQTPDNYLWFGTFGGLVRFDGRRFQLFSGVGGTQLPYHGITKLRVDSVGRLWMNSLLGQISYLFEGKLVNHGPAEGVQKGSGFSLIEPRPGELWLSRDRGVIKKWVANKFVPDPFLEQFKSTNLFEMIRDSRGNLYGSDLAAYLAWYNGKDWVQVRAPSGEVAESVYGFALARKGGIWTAVSGRIARLDGTNWVEDLGRYPWPSQFTCHVILEDLAGNIWAGSWGKGLFRYRDGKWTRFAQEDGLPHNVVRCLLQDHEGSIWVGTDGGGLARLRPRLFTNYDRNYGLPENIVTSVMETAPGEMWVGTHGEGLVAFKQGKLYAVPTPVEADNRWIWAIARDKSNKDWFGTYGGRVFGFEGKKYVEYMVPKKEESSINVIYPDKNNQLWIGAVDGFYCLTNGVLKQMKGSEVAGRNIQAIVEDRTGRIWLGGVEGLSYFENGTFTRVTETNLHIEGLYSSGEDIWATLSPRIGMCRVRNNRITYFGEAAGFPKVTFRSIIGDDQGRLWITAERGIYRVSLDDLEKVATGEKRTAEIFHYTREDGIGGTECPGGHQPNVWKSTDGRLWFGTVGGLSVLDPKKVEPNLQRPKVWIQDVIADGIVRRDPFQHQSEKAVIFPAGTRQIEIHYSGLSYIAPGQVLFKYQLEGLDSDWNEVGNRRVAYYQGLPPGDYRFNVVACNNDGLWSEAAGSILLHVQPFFWQTTWFQVGSCLATMFAVGGLTYRRLRRLEKQRQQQIEFSSRLIQSQEVERKRLANEIHDGLGQNFLILKNRAEIALQSSDTAEVNDQLREIADTAAIAVQEVRTLAHKLRPYQLDRLGLTLALQAMVKQFNSPGLLLRGEIEQVDKLLPAEHEIHFYRVIQESLNNVVKHSGATEVSLDVFCQDEALKAVIRDNGRGFDCQQVLHHPDSKRGLGLGGLLERARSMRGQIEITSQPGQGTTIRLSVNLKKNLHVIGSITEIRRPETPPLPKS
jgi:signal transduction histidine kinase/ligand-binding sensor domain-containing protein